jgi:hypothetical protein
MRKAKMMFVSLLAVFAVGAVSSASASALLWSVNGSTTFGTEKISEGLITIEHGLLTGDGLEITCPMLNIVGGLIKEGKTGMATSATFSECKLINKTETCVLSSETIETNPGTADLANATEIEVAPEGTNEFTTVKLNNVSGHTCSVKGKFVISGTARLEVGNASSEEPEHLLTLSAASNLAINGNASTIKGSGKGKLTSGNKWSIMATP